MTEVKLSLFALNMNLHFVQHVKRLFEKYFRNTLKLMIII